MPRLFLIDGSGYIYRSFYAVPPLCNSAGLPTNAIYGFSKLMLKFLNQYQPEYLAVVLDAGKRTFRNDMLADYKGNRKEAPADLAAQFPYFRKVLSGLGVATLELPGYEADDIIATLCTRLAGVCDVHVVTSDKDLMQLVKDRVTILDAAKDQWIGAEEVLAKFGVAPERVVEVMGLMGDAVDNIPGVRGIGAKTAIVLIKHFGTLENLYEAVAASQEMPLTMRGAPRVLMLLAANRDNAFLSRDLATVKRDVPIEIELEQLKYVGYNWENLSALFAELEFRDLAPVINL